MEHTFILKPGQWDTAGVIQDAAGTETPVQGYANISHAPDIWLNESGMTPVSGGERITNTYTIQPPAKPGAPMRWSSHNPALGALRGRFVFVGDTIVSIFDTEDGLHSGTELMKQVADDKYVNVGVLLEQGEKVSSWAIELRRKSAP